MQQQSIPTLANPVKLSKTKQYRVNRPFRGGKRYSQKKSFKNFIRQRDNWTCQLCGHYPSFEVDHIIPYAECHETRPANCRVLCTLCNRMTRRQRKDSRPPVELHPLSSRLKELRLALRLTQKALAEELGVGQTTIHRLENGRFNGHGHKTEIAQVVRYLEERGSADSEFRPALHQAEAMKG